MDNSFLFPIIDLFPIPMEVFSSSGVCLYKNLTHQNTLESSIIESDLGLSDFLQRIFLGEILSVYNLKIEGVNLDITGFPLLNEDKSLAYVIIALFAREANQTRLDAIRAKEYIDSHWMDDFNICKISEHTGLSHHYLTRLFKRFIGTTPYSYYQDVKLERIKEALDDPSLSISEAFTLCGVDYSGGFADGFKKKMGMTPSEYRKTPRERVPAHKTPICESEEELFQTSELFPIPIQIFKVNGDIVFINDATLKMWNVKDTSLILGKYNLIQDPFANGQPELKEGIRKAFEGESVMIPDVRIPLETFWDWYKTRSPVYDIEAIYTNILNFPVRGISGQMDFMMSIFFTSRIYQGNSEVAKAKEYFENNWREEYSIKNIAEVCGLSTSHLMRLFKKHTGITPHSYYKELKVARLKEALHNKNLSVADAFLSCGFKYPGNFARYFKEQVGMTPSQYRNSVE